MKKNEFNPYNLIVYYFKGSIVLGYIAFAFMVIYSFIDENLYKFFIILFLFFGINVMISMELLGRFGKKITIEIEKPKKPRIYKINDPEHAIPHIKKELLSQNYKTLEMTGIENITYVYKIPKSFHTYNWDQQRVIIFYEFSEFDASVVKFLKHQRKLIKEYYGKRDFALEIMFLVQLEKSNAYYDKYIKERVMQFSMNYYLEAFFLQGELQISRPDRFNYVHHRMRKFLLKMLDSKNFLIK